MRTKSYISTAALAAALLTTPQLAHGQALGLNLDIGGSNGLIDAGVNLGGDNGLTVGAGIGTSDGSLVDLDVDAGDSNNSSGSGGNLVDVDLGGPANTTDDALVDLDIGTRTGPNGGQLIDLDIGGDRNGADGATTGATTGSSLINGGVRLAALDGAVRADALIDLIANPKLGDVDLDAVIDDRLVSIVSVGDLLDADGLVDVEAALSLGGAGRADLLEALNGSAILGSILGTEGIDLSEVLAVQIAENGATQVIVLDETVELALLGDGGNLADLGASDLANLDIDALSEEELAAIDLDLLPDALRTQVQLRLLGTDGNLADLSAGDLANLDIDALSDEELARVDLDLLPQTLQTAIALRLAGNDGNLADLSVGDLAALDVDLPSSTGAAQVDLDLLPGILPTEVTIAVGDNGSGTPGTGTPGTGNPGTGNPGTGTPGTGGGNSGGDTGGSDTADSGSTGSGVGSTIGRLPATQVRASFGVAALNCDVGVLALANGQEADHAAIAQARSLELVRIAGCERSLMDAGVADIHAALLANPAISRALDSAGVAAEAVVGATIQGGTLTLFLNQVVS